MTNLSSLSKLHYANYAHIGVVAIALFISIIFFEFNVVTFLFNLANIAIAVYAYRQIGLITESVQRTSRVVAEANKGNFEQRRHNDQAGGELADLAHNVNNLFDQLESYMREVNTSIEYASHHKYFRRINTTGLNVTFRETSELINKSIDAMEEEYKAAQHDLFITELSKVGGSFIDNFEIIQGQIAETNEMLSQLAIEAQESATLSRSNSAVIETMNTNFEKLTHMIIARIRGLHHRPVNITRILPVWNVVCDYEFPGFFRRALPAPIIKLCTFKGSKITAWCHGFAKSC